MTYDACVLCILNENLFYVLCVPSKIEGIYGCVCVCARASAWYMCG